MSDVFPLHYVGRHEEKKAADKRKGEKNRSNLSNTPQSTRLFPENDLLTDGI